MSRIQRALHFIKVTAVFAVCWLVSAWIVPAFVEPGLLRMPVVTGTAFLACVAWFAVRSGSGSGAGHVHRSARAPEALRSSTDVDAGHGALAGVGLGAAAALGAQAFTSPVHDVGHSWDDALDGASSLPVINPATGLPMVGDSIGGVDVGGNLYGTQSSDMFGSDHAFGADTFATHSFSSDDLSPGISTGSSLDSW